MAHAGEKLTPGILGLIASVGAAFVTVYKPLKVAVFFSGSELTMPVKRFLPAAFITPTATR